MVINCGKPCFASFPTAISKILGPRTGIPRRTIRFPRSRSQDRNRGEGLNRLFYRKMEKLRNFGLRPKGVP